MLLRRALPKITQATFSKRNYSILTSRTPITFTVPIEPDMKRILAWANLAMKKFKGSDKIEVVQTDVAGTIQDPYCLAPITALLEIFSDLKISKTDGLIKHIVDTMGQKKLTQIVDICRQPERLSILKMSYPELNVEQIAEKIEGKLLEKLNTILPKNSKLTPYALQANQFLVQNDILIGATSGYNSTSLNIALSFAKKAGMHFSAITASDEKDDTRLKLVQKNNSKLGFSDHDMHKVAVFTDAVSDVKSVRSHQHYPWIFGVSGYSTHNRISSKKEAHTIDKAELAKRKLETKKNLLLEGAHKVIHDLSELPEMIVKTNFLLFNGKRPTGVTSDSFEEYTRNYKL